MGLVLIMQMIVSFIESPFRIPVAMIAFVAYIYALGRWVLRLKTRPLLPKTSKQKPK